MEELFKPTVPRLGNVTQELREHRISTDFLGKSLRTVLDNAHSFAKERKHGYIEVQDVKDSMAKECPYVFWC
jgi:hypothetical protein